jgi:hypothetical protein
VKKLPKILTWELLRCASCAWDVFFVEVAGFARQARPQSRPRDFWTHSDAKVRLRCPLLNPLSTVTYEIGVRYEIADPLKNLTGQQIRGSQ